MNRQSRVAHAGIAIVAAIAVLCATTDATAATFYPINSVATNVTGGGPALANLIQGSGVGFDAAEPHFSTGAVWYSDAPNGGGGQYYAPPPVNPLFTLDLGGDVALEEISTWGYSAGNANGIRDFNLRFVKDGEDPNNPGTWTIPDNPAFTMLQNPTPRQSFTFAPVEARYVVVNATSNYGLQPGAGAGGDRIGLHEFAVEDRTAVTVSPADGLVARWRLDEPVGTSGPGSVVDSVGGRNGTPIIDGSLTFDLPGANANTGTSADFNNTSIDVAQDAALTLNPASFTVTLWANPDSTGAHDSAITSRYDVGDTHGYILYNVSGRWEFWTGNGNPGWDNVSAPGAVRLNAWQHLAISYDDATNTKKLYVDGSLIAMKDGGGTSLYSQNTVRELHIGGGGDLGNEFRFDGSIDDVGIYNRALNQAEIQWIAAQGVPEPSSLALIVMGLVGVGAARRRRR